VSRDPVIILSGRPQRLGDEIVGGREVVTGLVQAEGLDNSGPDPMESRTQNAYYLPTQMRTVNSYTYLSRGQMQQFEAKFINSPAPMHVVPVAGPVQMEGYDDSTPNVMEARTQTPINSDHHMNPIPLIVDLYGVTQGNAAPIPSAHFG